MLRIHQTLLCAAAVVLALAGCSSSDSTAVPAAASLSLSRSSLSLDAVGATATVSASVLDQAGVSIAAQAVTWTSSNPAVATVTSTGSTATITAAGSGSAMITATAGHVTATIAVTVNQVATRLVIVQGNAQSAPANTALAALLQVQVTDRLNAPVPGVTVTFTPSGGSGSVSPTTATTGADGLASTRWTLGPTNGSQVVVASAAGLSSVTFTATIGAATTGNSLVIRAGDNQAAIAGNPLFARPAVRLTGTAGAPLAGITVTFAVTSGGGSITSPTVTTGADGVATAGTWTLGPDARVNTVTATAAGTSPVTFTAAGCTGGNTTTAFEITLCFRSDMTDTQRAAFIGAATKWGTVITGDLSPVAITARDSVGSQCPSSSDISMTVDDIVIFATVQPIDGKNGTLGQSGLCYYRSTSLLPITGYMEFDVADLAPLEAEGLLSATVLHEMGHVLGIGTLWEEFALLQDTSSKTVVKDTYYSGTNGIAGFNAIGGATYTGGKKVPVENTGGEGTINSHWRDGVLRNELMTGFINSGSNPLSLLTARSMQDLGYIVNAAAADPFSLSLSLRADTSEVKSIDLGNDVKRGPLFSKDASGKVTRIR